MIFTEPGISSATEPQLQPLQCSLLQVPLDGGVDDSSLVQTQDPALLVTNPQPECQMFTVGSSQKTPTSKKRKRETTDDEISKMHLTVLSKESRKLDLEIENLLLERQKLELEIQKLEA